MPRTPSSPEQLRDWLLNDDVYYAENCLKIVDQSENLVALRPKPAQLRFAKIIAAQEAAGMPVRVIVLKARKEGISTWTQGRMIKRITQRRNHKALVVAHDGDTASEIFQMGETMYAQLPQETVCGYEIKPPVVSSRKGQEIMLGEPSRVRRLEGHIGLNSQYKVDTANEYESGRGFTNHSLHLSELAFYKSAQKKLKALFNSVPDKPGTMIVIESTADGYNTFRKLWVQAIQGKSAYVPLFIPWWEEPDYRQEFANDEEKEEFFANIGTGEFGDAEPDLIEQGVSLEQLKWRRWAIINKSAGDLRDFWQEYPGSWEEAFLSAGRQVFTPAKVAKVIARTEVTEKQTVRGVLKPQGWTKRQYMGREIEIPVGGLWIPENEANVGVATPMWKLWEYPDRGNPPIIDPHGTIEQPARPSGQYVIQVDSASGRETASEGTDFFAIQVINHRTLEQAAVYHARGVDADQVALQAFLIANYFTVNFQPWLGVEITGGYGLSIANTLWRIYRYPLLYFRRPAEQKGEKPEQRLGWSMDLRTKPLIVDHAKQLLREGNDGIRDKNTAGEMQTYVRDEKGKMGAEDDYFDDLLEAWMVAQYMAAEKPLRRERTAEDAPKVRRAPTMNLRPHSYAR